MCASSSSPLRHKGQDCGSAELVHGLRDTFGASEGGQKHGEVQAHLFTSLGSCHGESGSHEVTLCKRRDFSLQEHCRSERRVGDGANGQLCNATGTPASCKGTNNSARSLE
jgi:hypothetical protein